MKRFEVYTREGGTSEDRWELYGIRRTYHEAEKTARSLKSSNAYVRVIEWTGEQRLGFHNPEKYEEDVTSEKLVGLDSNTRSRLANLEITTKTQARIALLKGILSPKKTRAWGLKCHAHLCDYIGFHNAFAKKNTP